jgi:transglutaminase-like putative cysteine protease
MTRVGGGKATQSQDGQSQSQSTALGCQALNHRFIGALRGLSVPARYVTGYVAADDRPAGLHAWVEAYDEGLGWIGFDCSRQLCPTDRYVRLAVGLDASSAAPVRSVPGPSAQGLEVVEVDAEQ